MRYMVKRLGTALVLVAMAGGLAVAQTFNRGSTGADGAFNPTATTTLTLPPDGVFHFTTITIPSGVTVRFTRNATNTPVTLLASGNVTINGIIDVAGANGGGALLGSTAVSGNGGRGGVGGFDGGHGATGFISTIGGSGQGPGGGAGSTGQPNILGGGGGGAGYLAAGTNGNGTGAGAGGAHLRHGVGASTDWWLRWRWRRGGQSEYCRRWWWRRRDPHRIVGDPDVRRVRPNLGARRCGGRRGQFARQLQRRRGQRRICPFDRNVGDGQRWVDQYRRRRQRRLATRRQRRSASRRRIHEYPHRRAPGQSVLRRGHHGSPDHRDTPERASDSDRVGGRCLGAGRADGIAHRPRRRVAGRHHEPGRRQHRGGERPARHGDHAHGERAVRRRHVRQQQRAHGHRRPSTASASLAIPTNEPSVISASASFTIVASTGGPVFVEGEEVERVRVAATIGGPTHVAYVMKSGRTVVVGSP